MEPSPERLLLLYVGAQDGNALDDVLLRMGALAPPNIWSLDTCRSTSHDMLQQSLYDDLCNAAFSGRILGVVGGPMCRTWSIRRHIPKPGGGRPLRTRDPPGVWGIPGLTENEKRITEGDTILLLRQMYLSSLAHWSRGSLPLHLLEHPADPMWASDLPQAPQCSSIWHTRMVQQWTQELGLQLVHMDQCRLGQVVPKTTTLATNLPLLHWGEMFCQGDHSHGYVASSGDLARYPPLMMRGIAQAIQTHLQLWATPSPPGTFGPDKERRRTDPRQVDRPTLDPKRLCLDGYQAQLQIWLGAKTRPIRDGGGKPSRGRLTPMHRAWSSLQAKGAIIMQAVEPHVAGLQWGPQTGTEHPFPESLLAEVRTALGPSDLHQVAPGQPFFLELLHHVASEDSDPDARYPLELIKGVPLGVTEQTLRSPDVWPLKEELAGQPMEQHNLEDVVAHANYQSAILHEDTIEQTFNEERNLDMVAGPFEAEEAASFCQCSIPDLFPGPLGAVEELDKVRTIYDGSVGHQNDHIRKHTVERTTSPTVADLTAALHWLHWLHGGHKEGQGTFGPDLVLLKADVSKAHRRIKILPSGWRYQVAVNKGKYWVNMVGTYGMASAQLYWGRMAALLLRVLYAIFPEIAWQFVYVDDFAWVLRGPGSTHLAVAVLVTLLAIGLPLSWKKTELNHTLRWLGFIVDVRSLELSLPQEKWVVLQAQLRRIQNGDLHDNLEVNKLVGRLQWATAAYPLVRPWLQPFWAWMVGLKGKGRPGKLLRMIAITLQHIFSSTYKSPSPYSETSCWYGATDAGADHNSATVGGWFTNLADPPKEMVFWFMLPILEKDFPWIYDKGTPQQRISTLELLGTAMLIKLILEKTTHEALDVPVYTDNQGNAFALLAGSSKRWPNSAIIMDLAFSLHSASKRIRPSFLKREYNEWADQLTHRDMTGFSPKLRLVPPQIQSWPVLPNLLEAYTAADVGSPGTFGPDTPVKGRKRALGA